MAKYYRYGKHVIIADGSKLTQGANIGGPEDATAEQVALFDRFGDFIAVKSGDAPAPNVGSLPKTRGIVGGTRALRMLAPLPARLRPAAQEAGLLA